MGKWRSSVPITPRGKASSGYGGVLPVKNGVVVDFFRMKDIVKIDLDNLTVTIQPGIVWEQLDRKLKKHKLTLPTLSNQLSCFQPEAGLLRAVQASVHTSMDAFKDNVISARVVLPDGNVKNPTL